MALPGAPKPLQRAFHHRAGDFSPRRATCSAVVLKSYPDRRGMRAEAQRDMPGLPRTLARVAQVVTDACLSHDVFRLGRIDL